VRLLDPCAGRGEAVATIARALGAESYGIELNEERALACRERLDHVLATSAFSVRLANGAFSALLLNPPYDYDEDKRRLEHAFLVTMTRALCPGGVLVFLVPQRRLPVSARYLASHYTRFVLYRFPDPEYAAYQQVVLFAVRKAQGALDPAAQAQLEEACAGELPPLPDAVRAQDSAADAVALNDPIAHVPAMRAGDVLFASLFFDPQQAAAEARRRGVWTQVEVTEQLWPADERPVRPLMPLRKGHLALLIAAGMLNNVVLRQGSERVLVKGRTTKALTPIETDDERTEVEREVIRTSVQVLDLRSGALEVVGQTDGPNEASEMDRTRRADEPQDPQPATSQAQLGQVAA
jgi:hypothetical protein